MAMMKTIPTPAPALIPSRGREYIREEKSAARINLFFVLSHHFFPMAYEPPKPSAEFYRGRSMRAQQSRRTDFPPPLEHPLRLSPPICPPSPKRIDDRTALHAKVARDNGLDYAQLEGAWKGQGVDVKSHLFWPDGTPRYVVSVDIWRPLIRAYFAWFDIPRENCTQVWEDIADNLLRLDAAHPLPVDFQAWAYGCLVKFYLADKKLQRESTMKVEEYDPMAPKLF
jgi:hypothetical protein